MRKEEKKVNGSVTFVLECMVNKPVRAVYE